MADSSAAFAFQLALSTDQVNVANHVYAPLQTLDAQFLKGTDIATTGGVITLPAVTAGNYFDFTGANAITGFSARTAGHRIYGQLDAAAQLTHNGTSFILPGAANIPGAAGNRFCMISEGAGNWRCLWYTRADGRPLVPTVILDNSQDDAGTNTPVTVTPRSETGLVSIAGNTGASSVDQAVTLSVPFSSLLGIVLGPASAGAVGGDRVIWATHTESASGFSLRASTTDAGAFASTASGDCRWFAFGLP